ncbi:MAG: CDP-alcohol phosphatidyltransferase family protein [Cyclobacteriaceae bacterium]|nr:CDP-alcohol phosphatidyltransferase family protein [Cyclobacteriaceae bacterium]
MQRFNPIIYLLFQAPRAMRLVNAISFFRVIAFPVLIVLMIVGNLHAFKWLIFASFITDALDGWLARKFQVISILGSRLDSLGDDLAILASFLGVIVFRRDFLVEQWPLIALMWALFFLQLGFAMARYQKPTSFHTYGAKLATVFQGVFLCSLFFLEDTLYPLFYATVLVTCLELMEEIAMVAVLRSWRSDVRGLYWALRMRPEEHQDEPNP